MNDANANSLRLEWTYVTVMQIQLSDYLSALAAINFTLQLM